MTIAGILLFSVFTVTPIGHFMGLTALPVRYYLFLICDVIGYLFFVSIAKNIYFKKNKELL